MNKPKKTTLLLLLAALPVFATAQSRTVNVLYLDGSSHKTLMEKIERIDIGNGEIGVVTKTGDTEKHAMSEIDRILLNDQTSDAIDKVNAKAPQLTVNGESIRIEGAEEGTPVIVFNTAGQCLMKSKATSGTTTLSTSGFANGTYIVRIGSEAYKVTIK